MYSYMIGEIKDLDGGRVVLENNGIGYAIQIPTSPEYSILKLDLKVKLFLHMVVSDSGIELFGFLTLAEKELFLMLKSISSFGSKLALSILSSMKISDIAYAVTSENKKLLTGIPGLGPKKADRLILELKDHKQLIDMMLQRPEISLQSEKDLDVTYITEILEELGCTPQEAALTVKKAISLNPSATQEELITTVFKVLDGKNNGGAS